MNRSFGSSSTSKTVPRLPGSLFTSLISEPRPFLELLGIPCALHVDFRRGAVDGGEILGRQLDIRSSEVLLEPAQLGGSRDRNDPRLLREKPRQRDLPGRRVLSLRTLSEQMSHRTVRLPR